MKMLPHPPALTAPAWPRLRHRRGWHGLLPAGARLFAGLAVLGAAMTLAGCGPGVGGTGTGGAQPSLSDFGATSAVLCDSSVAGNLRCPPAGSSPPETLPVLLADGDPPVRAQGRIDGNSIELHLRCEGLVFAGRWGQIAGREGERFYGAAQGANDFKAAAVLEFAPAGGGFLASLQDPAGAPLAAPVLLLPVPSLRMPAPCP